MTNLPTNKLKKLSLKKYIIFLLMFLLFGASMWFIFSPKDIPKEEIKSGYNDKIPEPTGNTITEDKRDAYEQEWLDKQKDEKMKSLQDYSSYLNELSNETKSTKDVDLMGNLSSDTSIQKSVAKEPTAIQSSVNSYKDINKTLGNFYEEPEIDPEKEELRLKLEKLESRISENENKEDLMDEQVALMEKSYQMAARYLPQSQGQNSDAQSVETTGNNGPVTLIRQFQDQVVSALAPPLNNEEFIQKNGNERNLGFHSISSGEEVSDKNTIDAITDGQQTVVSGQSVRLRLLEPIMAGSKLIPKYTTLTGTAKVQGERLFIKISMIEHEGSVLPVDISVLDLDGQEGIFIPGSMEIEAVKEIIANAGAAVGTSFTLTQDAGEQIVSDLTKGLIQGSSQYMRKKLNQIKVTIKPGYKLLLLPNQKS